MANVAQRSFSGGEIAPSLYGRTDYDKYRTALRKCLNWIVQRHGGLTNRPGLQYIAARRDATAPGRLVKFVFNDDQTYVLEFGDYYVRVIRDGAQLESAGDPYEIVSPYAEADLMDLRYVQSGDVITIVHPSYPPQRLSRTADTAWAFEAITFGASIGSVANLAMGGGAAGDTTYYAVTAIDELTGEEGLPSFIDDALEPSEATPIELTWDALLGAGSYRVYRSTDGTTYEEIESGSAGTPTPISDTTWSDDSESVNTMLMNTVVAAAGQCRNDVIAGGVDKPYNSVFTVKGTLAASIAGPNYGVVKGQVRAYYKRDAEARVDAGVIFTQYMSGTAVSSGASAFSANITVPDNGYTTLQLDFVPEVEAIYQVGSGNTYTAALLFTTAPNNVIERSTIGTGFFDDGSPGDPLSTPPLPRSLFDAVGKYPTAVMFYQQRLILANTTNEPETTYTSRTGAYSNFYISNPLQDDDAVTWSNAGRQVNSIQHMLDLGRLIQFTTGSEIMVEGDEAGILRPDAINPRAGSYNGIGRLPPIPMNDSAMFVQARLTRVRDLQPDGDRFTSRDLTVLAAHLFLGHTLVDWDFADIPNSTIWAVRDDGVLLGLTWMPDQDVWGWHRHTTDGLFERVCVVPEGGEDRLYCVVKRTIDGDDVRYIERLTPRYIADVEEGVFMDSALTYDGWNDTATTVTLSAVSWTLASTKTVTASASAFSAGDVGNAVIVKNDAGDRITITITGFTSATVVTGTAAKIVPAALRAVATTEWALAVDVVTGLEHLEGEDVSVLGDGFVIASPNNEDYDVITVTGGEIELPEPRALIHVGLPYMSDGELLDIDTPQGPSVKPRKTMINKVTMFLEASRGLWVGPREPSGADPLEGLSELNIELADEYEEQLDIEYPENTLTGSTGVVIDNSWKSNGRIFWRQVDPLPATVLAAIPEGSFA
jgi:hypothetical protein